MAELEPAPVVAIERGRVRLNGGAVRDPEDFRQRLDLLRRSYGLMHPGRTFPGSFVLLADRATPFGSLRQVLAAARRAGYGLPQMAVETP